MIPPVVEISFRVQGDTFPLDNGYPLFSAISKTLGGHLPPDIGVFPLYSKLKSGNFLILDKLNTCLRIRTPAAHIPLLISLSGKQLIVNNCVCMVGVPNVYAVTPSPILYSPFVTFKNSLDEGRFLEVVQRELAFHEINATPCVPKNRKGFSQRKIRTIHDRKVVGFGLHLGDLSDRDSLKLLTNGLGGRRHMGAGLFVSADQP